MIEITKKKKQDAIRIVDMKNQLVIVYKIGMNILVRFFVKIA